MRVYYIIEIEKIITRNGSEYDLGVVVSVVNYEVKDNCYTAFYNEMKEMVEISKIKNGKNYELMDAGMYDERNILSVGDTIEIKRG